MPQHIRDQLDKIFAAAHCEHLLEAALDWWVTSGAATLEELNDEWTFEEFEKDMDEKGNGLKKLQSHRLKNAIKEALGEVVTVKNTFIDDYKKPTEASALSRAQTVAGNYSGHIGGSLQEKAQSVESTTSRITEDEEWTAPAPKDGDITPGRRMSTPKMSSSLYRIETHEDHGFGQYKNFLERFGTHEDYGFSMPYHQAPGVESTAEDDSAERDEPPGLDPFLPPPPGMGMPMMAPHVPMMPMMPMMPMTPMTMPWPPWIPMGYQNPGAEREMKPQTVQFVRKHYRRRDGKNEHRNQYHWTVDGRKLRSSDREAVSPQFTVKDCYDLEFKLVLKPKVVEYVKGGSSFRNSRGKGYIELRCVSENSALMLCEATLSFKLSISSAKRTEKFRGSVFHNFRERATCGLVESQDEWEFGKIVDDTGTFIVILECDPKT